MLRTWHGGKKKQPSGGIWKAVAGKKNSLGPAEIKFAYESLRLIVEIVVVNEKSFETGQWVIADLNHKIKPEFSKSQVIID